MGRLALLFSSTNTTLHLLGKIFKCFVSPVFSGHYHAKSYICFFLLFSTLLEIRTDFLWGLKNQIYFWLLTIVLSGPPRSICQLQLSL